MSLGGDLEQASLNKKRKLDFENKKLCKKLNV
jgi:hypothetical protein